MTSTPFHYIFVAMCKLSNIKKKIIVVQIKLVFSQRNVTNQRQHWKITTNQSCTPYQITELLRTLWLVKKLCFLILHRLTPTYVRRWLLWWMYREDKPWSLHLKPSSNLLLLHTIVFLEQAPARHLHAFSPVLLASRAGFWRQETHRLNKQFTS